MDKNVPRRAISLLIVLPVLLSAQLARQHDPAALKHWASPLYWQPTLTSAEPYAVAQVANAAGLPANANPLVFVAMQPCRVVDTRTAGGFSGTFGPPSLAAGAIRTFAVQTSSTCVIPAVARAYSLFITVVPPGPLGYVTVYPTGQSAPVAAVAVMSPQGSLIGTSGVVPAGTNGSVDIYATDRTDIVVDINGYYAPIGDLLNNTAAGTGALANNTTGYNNTAAGNAALANNTTGYDNTAAGNGALASNTTGRLNTAVGKFALGSNTIGSLNTAIGEGALQNDTTGSDNTAIGEGALQYNTTGYSNMASGVYALMVNTTGGVNTASGHGALVGNTTGYANTASGYSAMAGNTTGFNNIAIGTESATNVSGTNSNNIHIGSFGASSDANTIRIGGTQALKDTATQSRFFAAGIRGVTTGNNDAIPVVIDSNGQLGTVSSSRRFKEDIHDMDTASSDLLRLRPVTFRYQKPFADGSRPIQYGLIAEEVSEVYPDLVARSSDGQIETVKYQVLNSMLLNELQKEHVQLQQQSEMIRLLQARLAALEEALRSGK
jgi:hypothetical protein